MTKIAVGVCTQGWALVPGSDQAREMARAAIGEGWLTADELSVLTLATRAPMWAEYPHRAAWGWLATKRGRDRTHPIVVEAQKVNGEWLYRASGLAEPLPRGEALVAAIVRRLNLAIDHLMSNCDGGSHPAGHTVADIEKVPTISATRAWLAERAQGELVGAATETPEVSRVQDHARREVIEARAVDQAVLYYGARGWSPTDVSDPSLGLGYDIRFNRGDEQRHVEVKGTSGSGSTVSLTRNEVEHASSCGDPALFVLSQIEVSYDESGAPSAAGGVPRVYDPWHIDDDDLTPLTYSYRLPPFGPGGKHSE